MDLCKSLAGMWAEKRYTSASRATNSKDHPRGSACMVEFGMGAYQLANVSLYSSKVCGNESLPLAIFCPDLDQPQYGSVRIIRKNIGGKAVYKCNYGYKLYGSTFRKCLHSGIWGGSQPTCKRRFPLCPYSIVGLNISVGCQPLILSAN